MFCRKCGHQINDSASFCNNCGAKIELLQNKVFIKHSVSSFGNEFKSKIWLLTLPILYVIINIVATYCEFNAVTYDFFGANYTVEIQWLINNSLSGVVVGALAYLSIKSSWKFLIVFLSPMIIHIVGNRIYWIFASIFDGSYISIEKFMMNLINVIVQIVPLILIILLVKLTVILSKKTKITLPINLIALVLGLVLYRPLTLLFGVSWSKPPYFHFKQGASILSNIFEGTALIYNLYYIFAIVITYLIFYFFCKYQKLSKVKKH